MTPDLRLQIARCDGGTCGDVEDSDAKGSVTDCAAAYRDDGAVLAVAARDDVAAAFHKEGAAAETRKLEGRVTAVAAGFHEGERVSAAATRGKLYVNDFWEFATNLATAAGGAVEAPANGLSFSNGGLWIAHGFGLQRYDVSTGVVAAAPAPPIANATAVAASDESVWVAGASGAARFRDGAWRVFAGRRWLAPGPATAVAAVGSRGALVATAGGLAVFRSENWTLAQKADYFEAVAATTFDRHGLGGDVDLASVGDVSTSTGRPGDNDGLWTSLLTTSYAYAVADAARAEERETFEALLKKRAEGMEGLFATAAPNHSYPARTVATVDECAAVGCDPPDWHASTTRDGWKYDGRADLSVEPGRGDAGENSVEDKSGRPQVQRRHVV